MAQGDGIYAGSSGFLFMDIEDTIKGELKSSLQSFETSLLMISLGRWTHTIIHLFNAIEIVIKDKIEDKSKMEEKTDEFFYRYQISNELIGSFKNVRKLRNKFVHEATIPDDNVEGIVTYLNDGLSVYKKIVEISYRINIYELLYPKEIATNLIFAKNLIKRNLKKLYSYIDNNNEKKDFIFTNVHFYLSVVVKTIANNYYALITPKSIFDIMQYNDNALYDEIEAQKASYQEILEDNDVDVDHELSVPCPASCEGKLSVGFNNNEPEEYFIHNVIGQAQCTLCGLSLYEGEMLDEYVKKYIDEEKILKSFGLKKP